jgi:hypothetical protein
MIEQPIRTPDAPLPFPPAPLNGGDVEVDTGETPLDLEGELEIIMLPDGGAEINVGEDEDKEHALQVPDIPFDANLAEFMDESDMVALANDIKDLVEADLRSRKAWEDLLDEGMKEEDRIEPWQGACSVKSPLLTEAAVRFQSEMITETFPAEGPVKTRILGEETPDNKKAAERVREDMNYRLTDSMVEYRPEHERMLYSLGLTGAAFKKVYRDANLGRGVSMFVPAEDLIIPYGASSVYTAERVTHRLRITVNEYKRQVAAGFYVDAELGDPMHQSDPIDEKKAKEQGFTLNDDDRYVLHETHVYLELEGDDREVPAPYIITREISSNKVLSIRRNWDENDEKMLKKQHFVQYTYVPGAGSYGLGYYHLIGGYARADTSILRQLVDAGTLSNLPGGLKTRGMRIKGDDTPIPPGEFRDVDVPSGTIKDNIMTLPYKEPSQVLAGLRENIKEDGRRLASVADLQISDMSAQTPVGTTLALLERQLKTMSAVQARAHASLRMEFKLLKALIREDAEDQYGYVPEAAQPSAKRADYDVVEIIPVSDPNATTMAQRIMQYQAAFQMSQAAPQAYNVPYLHRQMLEVLGIKNANKIVPIDEDVQPRDPISENMGFLTGKPAQAFIYQDHDAHIAVHMSMMQDPTIMGMFGQTPMAQQLMGAIMAHVAQHVAFGYRAKVEEHMGVPLPPPDEPLPPEIEAQMARLVAQAATQLLQGNMQKAQAQQAQAAAQDPKLMLEGEKVAVKKAEVATRAQDSERDYELGKRKLALEEKRVQAQSLGQVAQIASQERQTDKKIRADVVKTVHMAKQQKDKNGGQQK